MSGKTMLFERIISKTGTCANEGFPKFDAQGKCMLPILMRIMYEMAPNHRFRPKW